MTIYNRETGSFRDPAGFLFRSQGTLYRQVNQVGRADYDSFIASGLYKRLVEDHLLVPHHEVDEPIHTPETAYKILQPQPLAFISYPYEWAFSQLRAAALLTLRLQRTALEHNLSLKDASAYNIQFLDGRPLLIDTLSFEQAGEGRPWTAYRQFCQHFLAPLALMSHTDIRLGALLRSYLDGIPLDLASRLLPRRTWLKPGLLIHLHLHAVTQRKAAGQKIRSSPRSGFSRASFMGLLDSLQNTVRALSWKPEGTAWGDYYAQNAAHYSAQALSEKQAIISRFLDRIQPRQLWDLGANTGLFSRLSSQRGIDTLAFDIDPAAVEQNYRQVRQQKETHLLPLLLDLTNPSPGLGWAGAERAGLLDRRSADTVMALALIHHLAIGNNLPLQQICDLFITLGRWLIIEFVPKEDSQVQLLLSARLDIFPDYTLENFIKIFSASYEIIEQCAIPGTPRTLFLLRVRDRNG